MLTPEHSIQIQNIIGADIIMQLDDVVKSTLTGPRVEEAMHRYLYYVSCITPLAVLLIHFLISGT